MVRFLGFILIFAFFSLIPAFADDMDFWDEPIKIDSDAKSQQKAVTDQEFEKVMEHFEKNKKKKDKKKMPKGTPIGPQVTIPNEDEIQSSDPNSFKVTYEAYPTVMVPVTLVTYGENDITPGYYRVLSVQKDGKYYLNFYQGNTLVAKVPALNTGNDHNQKSLNYAKLIPVNDHYMDVIYGDIDCNIEARLDIKQN